MKRRGGQAGRILGEAFHQIGNLILVLFSLALFGVCLLGLRLSRGPLEVPHLASMLATAVSGQGISVDIQEAELAWAGYTQGGGVPLYLRLGGIAVRNKEDMLLVSIPGARLRVVPSALFGSHAPIDVSGNHAQFVGSAVPVSLQAELRLGVGLKLSHARLQVVLGAGRLGAGPMSLPISSGGFTLDITPHTAALKNGVLILTPVGHSAPKIGFAGSAVLNAQWQGGVTLTADTVQAADLSAYWPPLLAPHSRHWVTKNIVAGTASNGLFNFGLAAPRNLSAVHVTSASGSFLGHGLTLFWLDHARPITGLNGQMKILDRNTALITSDSARLGGLGLSLGRLKIVGLSAKDQTGYLSLNVNGTIQDSFAILNAEPINLLAKAPPGLASAKGIVAANVNVIIPFIDNLPFADIGLHVAANLTRIELTSPVAGLKFTEGAGRVDATGQDLKFAARAIFAGEPATIALEQGFTDRSQNFTLASRAGPVLLRELGLDEQTALADPVGGILPYTATVSGDPEGAQNLSIDANLTPAEISLPGFAWAKPAGQAGRLNIRAKLNNGALKSAVIISATAPELDIQSQLRGTELIFPVFDIGGTKASGTLDFPKTGGVWSASFSGPVLDMRANMLSKANGGSSAPPSGPAWRLRLAFTRLRLASAPAPELTGFSLAANGQGDTPLQLHAAAQGVILALKPLTQARRALALQARDAGTFLKATGAYGGMRGGTLGLNADFGGAQAASGTVNMEKFRILQAPAFAKVLQGLTVYGAPQAASGPGLEFSHAVIPFSIAHDTLSLNDARAYSASLGFTATGTIALADDDANLNATIVPAYAFNALPGKIPVLGRLFTAEKGGGLFAVRAKITGKLSNPKVAANPLSALTPGVLRGIFGLHKPPAK